MNIIFVRGCCCILRRPSFVAMYKFTWFVYARDWIYIYQGTSWQDSQVWKTAYNFHMEISALHGPSTSGPVRGVDGAGPHIDGPFGTSESDYDRLQNLPSTVVSRSPWSTTVQRANIQDIIPSRVQKQYKCSAKNTIEILIAFSHHSVCRIIM